MSEIKFDIIGEILALPAPKNNLYHTEVNIISWAGGEPKLDIRKWADNHVKCSKGIALSMSEAKELFSYADRILEVISDGMDE